ncbi:hypothetical protein BHF68_14035 [Desulfuribacillus alkaliarsenatis]|uniref:DUF115 domain-containing protein n=2 Tax=Desulfuribacillus alkaliarsenatis TaxID=766136 RepID=A0A1E5G4V9_9FIRM|nr:hypothetical protein BHF68_14035 [Desulfuribacillus alkaliarsenatis]
MNLDNNLSVLKSKNEQLHNELIGVANHNSSYQLIETKNKQLTVKLIYNDGLTEKEQLIHSKYNPIQEAEKFANAYVSNKKSYILYGFGLGYHVEALLNAIDVNSILYVIDLDIQLFKIALLARDFTKILSDDRLNLLVSSNEKKVANDIKRILDEDAEFITYTPSVNTIPSKFSYFKFILEDWKMQQTVTDKWTGMLHENSLLNKEVDCPNAGVLFGSYQDVPMVLVSAGPSLNKNKHLLKFLKGKFLIFAVGSALKPLLKSGVKPDYFCIIDPKPSIYKQIEGYESLDIPLIFLDTASSSTVLKYQGPKYKVYNKAKNHVEEQYIIHTGGSVATAVLDLGIKFGCNPIIFTGQDLAYTNNEHHADGKMYNPNANEKIKELPNMRRIEGQNGEVLNTTLGLLSFKYWIENKIKANPSISFYNATEGGAIIEGAKHSTLLQTIEQIYINNIEQCMQKIQRADSVIILLGIGLGFELTHILQHSPNSNIIIIEPVKDNIKIAIEFNQQIEKLISNKNITFLANKDIREIEKKIKEFIDIKNKNNIHLIRSISIDENYNNTLNEIEKTINKNIKEIDMHLNTTETLSELISNNIMQNLPEFKASKHDLNILLGAYKDKPAIIVSAGPSLEKNIQELKNYRDNAVIIAGPRTVKPLIENGITPHILCNMDPKDSMYELVKDYSISDIPLVTLMQGNHKLVAAHQGQKVFVFDEYLEPIKELINGDKPISINFGGSVATFSLSVAAIMECNPIIFIGQDLAYISDKKHAFGNSNIETPKDAILAKDINGEDVLTREDWLYFKKNIEGHISKASNIKFINATEAGLYIEGADHLSLKDTIQNYCKVEFYPEIILKNIFIDENIKDDKQIQIKQILIKVQKVKKHIKENHDLAEDIYKYIKHTKCLNIDKVLKKMDNNDKHIENEPVVNALIHYPIQLDYMHITLSYSAKSQETPEQEQIRIARKNIAIYKAKLKAIEYVESALQQLK